MEKKLILFVVHQLNIGGVQKALLAALDALDYSRFEVTLYVQQDRTELIGRVNPNVREIYVNRDETRYYRRPRAVWYAGLIRAAKAGGKNAEAYTQALNAYVAEEKLLYEKKRFPFADRQFDVAVAFKQGGPARFAAEAVDAKRKIVLFHGSVDEDHALHARILPQFDVIAAVNEGCRDILRALYPAVAEKITYIENYVDAEDVRARAAAYPVDRSDGPAVLCTCGRMTPVKGFDLALDAAALLRDCGQAFIWYFVGDGPERAALEEKTAALRLEDRVRFTGMLENPCPYIAGCDIYVQPSREESYGLTIAEAQILGRPVVATATVGGRSNVRDGETGCISAVSAADLAEKTAALLADRELYAHMQEALRRRDCGSAREVFCSAWNALLDG
ncbi:MAG: glycosyltransferase [Clostridia bacterium]|nr:glycosyltransferase [Clostridia bacterium]